MTINSNEPLDWSKIPEKTVAAWCQRVELAESLLIDSLTPDEKKEIIDNYCVTHQVSERTVRNYVSWYKEDGAKALLFYREKEEALRITDQELAEKILALIKEQPWRTIPGLRRLLTAMPDFKDKIALVSDRTVYRFVMAKGFSAIQRKLLSTGHGKRCFHQFEAPMPLALVQGDARDGIWLKLPGNEKPVKTYLFVWVDDFSRKILYGEYYLDEKLPRMEDSFRKMILRYGLPEKIYLDNGSVYISRQFRFLLSDLDIKKIHHPPYAAYCKGKVEAVQKTVKNDFQSEAQRAGFTTLAELNTAFWAWMDTVYNTRRHSTTGQSPDQRFKENIPKSLRRVTDLAAFENAFLFRESRTVSKYGSIKLSGNIYKTRTCSAGQVIEVRYNPFDLTKIFRFEGNKFIETMTTEIINHRTLLNLPEERPDSKLVSEASRNYFTKLRENHHREILEKQSGISFVNIREGEKNDR